MAAKVRMDDIAKELGISKNTVSLAFRGFPGVNDTTRTKVFDTAARLGYIYAKGASNETPNTGILIIMPTSARDSFSFFSHMQFGIESIARANNLNTFISYYDDEVGLKALPQCIKDEFVSGIITLGRIDKEVYTLLQSSGLPIVVADHYYDDLFVDSILSDNYCGAYMAVKHLLSKGHRKIGFIGDTSISPNFHDRFLGYTKALENSGIDLIGELIIKKPYSSLLAENISPISPELFKSENIPSAFFCCNDMVAINLIKNLSIFGIRVPEDVSIVGFDDIDLAANFFPELTTVRVEKELMGIKAIYRLLDVFEGRSLVPQKTLLAVSIIERNSVKSPN